MTIKTFESALPDNRTLEVDTLFGNPRLLLKELNGSVNGFNFDKADAPALCLAVMETAGHAEPPTRINTYNYFGLAMHYLRKGFEEQEIATAEAKAQAELEAEAFKLRRAYLVGRTGFDSWNELTDADRENWLAVARKAREMRAEK